MKYIFILLVAFSLLFSSNKNDKPSFKCNKKKYCKQMKSCKEAMLYLKHCGLTRLDRDKDGIPCEKICKGK